MSKQSNLTKKEKMHTIHIHFPPHKRYSQSPPFTAALQRVDRGMRPHVERILHAVLALLPTSANLKSLA